MILVLYKRKYDIFLKVSIFFTRNFDVTSATRYFMSRFYIPGSMQHHIVDHVICSSAIPQFAKSLNLIGELLSLSRDVNNKLYVEDVQIVARDIMGTNGVVHVIDGLLTTRQGMVWFLILSTVICGVRSSNGFRVQCHLRFRLVPPQVLILQLKCS